MLWIANGVLHGLHLGVIAFSVVGWLWPATRAYHLALAALIAASWFVLGTVIGQLGFCWLTGVQHAVWARMGRRETLSYMSYLVERWTGHSPDARRVDIVTQAVFYATTTASLGAAWSQWEPLAFFK